MSIATRRVLAVAFAALITGVDQWVKALMLGRLQLPEVGQIPDTDRQDPIFFRNRSTEVGRDGCRVPLPWASTGSSFGFGDDGAHLPQPTWFAEYAVDVEDADPHSTLAFYRRALRLRQQLQAAETLTWQKSERPDVLHFVRPGGWHVVTNFGTEPVSLPGGRVLLASGDLPQDGRLPGETTVWLQD